MVSVELQFTAGRYHANPWGRHINEGAAEWPPSPWRFLRALLAVWRAGGDPGEETTQALLQKLAHPLVFHLPRTSAGHTRHYVPHGEERSLMLDAFIVAPEAITITWPEAELEEGEETALDTLLAKLTYLGRAESWCRAKRVPPPEGPPQSRPLERGESYVGKTVTLLCPEPSATLEQLEITTGEVRRRRLNRPPGSHWVTYAIEDAEEFERAEPRPQLAVFVVHASSPLPKEQTLRLADRVRRELLRLHGKVSSPVFGGKVSGAVREDDHSHLHVLPEGEETLERVLLWAPSGFGPGEVQVLRKLSSIPAQGRQPALRLLAWDLVDHPGETFGRSSTWLSSTPYVPSRHAKPAGKDSLVEQILRECHLRGLPQPDVSIIRPAPADYITHRHGQPRAAGPAHFLRLTFPQPIPGPLVLGANSHFGMGRFEPHQEESQNTPAK